MREFDNVGEEVGPEAVLVGGSLLENDNDESIASASNSPFYDALTNQNSQMRAVDRLWSYCESSTTSVKLILPDALTTPYYLPTPRGPKQKTPQQIAREQARLDFLVRREVSGRASSLGSNSVRGILPSLTSSSSAISRKEK
jgi:hypothetical protein